MAVTAAGCRLTLWTTTLAAIFFLTIEVTHAHPGTPHEQSSVSEAALDAFMKKSMLSYQDCSDTREARNLQKRSIDRRQELMARLSSLDRRKRDPIEALNTNHHSNRTGLTSASKDEVFKGNTAACLLTPEISQGPYYVKGEFIRSDIRESQVGVPLFVDIQFIDIYTCQGVPNLYVDWWHANATGVYAGVINPLNGNFNDTSNINATFLRGLTPTDDQGVLQYQTIFPGHYTGRANHAHIVTHLGGTVLPNGTYVGGAVQHVGQVFFDQDLITRVEATAPYNTNKQVLTLNNQDSNFTKQAAGPFDPMLEYVLLGDTIEYGLLAWATIVIDVKQSLPADAFEPASFFTQNGGMVNPNAPFQNAG